MQLQNLFPITVDLPIKMPDGTETGIVLKVVGQDSQKFRRTAKQFANVMLASDQKPTAEELEKHGAELAAACIAGWTGLEEGEQPIPYSHEKAVELMSMPELSFIREQVEGFASKRANFFRSSKAVA